MTQVKVQKVPAADDRSLPVFADLDRLAELIRVEAYNLFTGRGTGDGHALDDWLEAERKVCWPSAELDEQDGEYTLKVALAGYDAGDISVTATPRELIVKAAREQRARNDNGGNGGVRWSEFRSNDAFRRVELPGTIAVDKTTAKFENGLLEIVAPKAEAGAQQQSESKVNVTAGPKAAAPAK